MSCDVANRMPDGLRFPLEVSFHADSLFDQCRDTTDVPQMTVQKGAKAEVARQTVPLRRYLSPYLFNQYFAGPRLPSCLRDRKGLTVREINLFAATT
jgi:hypothetical protein